MAHEAKDSPLKEMLADVRIDMDAITGMLSSPPELVDGERTYEKNLALPSDKKLHQEVVRLRQSRWRDAGMQTSEQDKWQNQHIRFSLNG